MISGVADKIGGGRLVVFERQHLGRILPLSPSAPSLPAEKKYSPSVLCVPLCMYVQLERIFVKLPELLKDTLQICCLGNPPCSRPGGSLNLICLLLLLLSLLPKRQQES